MSGIRKWCERHDPSEVKQSKKATVVASQKLIDVLGQDFDRVLDDLQQNPADDLLRRTLVRTLFAYVEGATYALAREILWYCDNGLCDLQSTERDRLQEAKSFLPLKERVRFTFSTYSERMIGRSFELDTGGYEIDSNGSDWQNFLRAIKVRDRLMHPKSIESLRISNEELNSVARCGRWFERLFLCLMKAGAEVSLRTVMEHLNPEKRQQLARRFGLKRGIQ